MKIQRSFLAPRRRIPSTCVRAVVVNVTCLLIILACVSIILTSRHSFEKTERMLEEMEKWKGRFEVELPGCRIPYIDPRNEVIMRDWFVGDETTCIQQARYFLSTKIRGNETCLVVHDDILLVDYGVLPDRIRCTYQTIDVSFDGDPWINLYSYTEPHKLEWGHCFEEPHVWIECDIPRSEKYKQALFIAKDIAPRTKYISVDAKSPPPLEKDLARNKNLNVLVLGVDAVSRPMFHRLMTKTSKKIRLLYGKDLFELTAFNKVGANSAPNQIPMLTGRRFRHDEDLVRNEYFEDFGPFVWDNFSDAGYTTFFVEEQMRYGLFNFPSRRGFRDIPTDYWPRPLTLARDFERRRRGGYSGCMGDEHVSTTLLKYWIQVQQVSTSPTFSYIWLSEATHDSPTGAKTADSIISQFFDDFERAGLTQETIVFMLADHGYRMAPFRETPIGALEDLLPFAFVLLPRSYRTTNPDDVSRLEENRNRLSTPYDIHATLMDLAARSRGQRVEATKLGQSLMSSRFAPQRNCETAGIDPQYCACYSQETLGSSTSLPTDQMAEETIETINQVLRDNGVQRKCLRFADPRIQRIVALGMPQDRSEFKFFKMTIKTNLDPATFESVFKVVNGTFSLIGLPERLDRYDYYSSCVHETFFEKFCYCDTKAWASLVHNR